MDQRKRIRLARYSTKAGCASKVAPGDLEQALEGFVGGVETRDDGGYVPFGGEAGEGARVRVTT